MKKISLLLIAITLLLASCGKDPEKEWSRFYGFVQSDVVGHFEANPDESLYESLPTEGVAVYNNASMDVTPVGSNNLTIHVVIPGKVNRTFSGPINMSNENRSDIAMVEEINNLNKEDLLMTVYKNDKGQVRFHGRVKHYHYRYNNDTQQYDFYKSDNWGFDVIKQE